MISDCELILHHRSVVFDLVFFDGDNEAPLGIVNVDTWRGQCAEASQPIGGRQISG